MSEVTTLEAQLRTTIGKQVRQLRAQELIPAVIYGPKLEKAIQIQVPERALKTSLREAGGTNVIEIDLGDSKHNVLVRDVQRDVLLGNLLHVDFYAVSLDTRIRTEVPIMLVGKSAIVASGEAMLLTGVNSIEVECLPMNIPNELKLDLSRLKEIGDYLTVADLDIPAEVTVLAAPDEELVRAEPGERLMTAEEAEEEMAKEVDAEDVEVIKRGKAEEEEEEED
jgi:large subunit ribosomal protein L25